MFCLRISDFAFFRYSPFNSRNFAFFRLGSPLDLGRSMPRNVNTLGRFSQKKCWQNPPHICDSLALNFMLMMKSCLRSALILVLLGTGTCAFASEAELRLPNLRDITFPALGGVSGFTLMLAGIGVCALAALFG